MKEKGGLSGHCNLRQEASSPREADQYDPESNVALKAGWQIRTISRSIKSNRVNV